MPHGNVRLEVLGMRDLPLVGEPLRQAQALVEQGLKEGAVGFSTGLSYYPQSYSDTTEIVELCGRGDRSIGQVARDFDLTETAVREWVRQAERDAGRHRDGGLTSAERQELSALRRENRRLREDVEILKRATSFFAKETR